MKICTMWPCEIGALLGRCAYTSRYSALSLLWQRDQSPAIVKWERSLRFPKLHASVGDEWRLLLHRVFASHANLPSPLEAPVISDANHAFCMGCVDVVEQLTSTQFQTAEHLRFGEVKMLLESFCTDGAPTTPFQLHPPLPKNTHGQKKPPACIAVATTHANTNTNPQKQKQKQRKRAMRLYTEQHGEEGETPIFKYPCHGMYDLCFASLSGRVDAYVPLKRIVDVKIRNNTVCNDKISDTERCQMEAYMRVLHVSECDLVEYCPYTDTILVHTYQRDAQLWAAIRQQLDGLGLLVAEMQEWSPAQSQIWLRWSDSQCKTWVEANFHIDN